MDGEVRQTKVKQRIQRKTSLWPISAHADAITEPNFLNSLRQFLFPSGPTFFSSVYDLVTDVVGREERDPFSEPSACLLSEMPILYEFKIARNFRDTDSVRLLEKGERPRTVHGMALLEMADAERSKGGQLGTFPVTIKSWS